jgi:hypothetical protein
MSDASAMGANCGHILAFFPRTLEFTLVQRRLPSRHTHIIRRILMALTDLIPYSIPIGVLLVALLLSLEDQIDDCWLRLTKPARQKREAKAILKHVGIECVHDNIDAVVRLGFFEALKQDKLRDPKIFLINDAVVQLQEKVSTAGGPRRHPRTRDGLAVVPSIHADIIYLLPDATRLLAAGKRVGVIYEPQLSHETPPCWKCAGDTSCWGACPEIKTIIDRPERLVMVAN